MSKSENNLQYSYDKGQCDYYYIVFNKGWDGARVFVDSREGSGTLSVISSFGNFGYTWNSIGNRSFKDFLAGLGFDYFMGKACPDYMQFDGEKTVKNFLKEYDELKKEENEDYNPEDDYLRDALEQMSDEHDENSFCWRFSHEELDDIFPEFYHDLSHSPTASATGFWNEVWPRILDVFAKEKQGEAINQEQE
jgi:hypothetical protein